MTIERVEVEKIANFLQGIAGHRLLSLIWRAIVGFAAKISIGSVGELSFDFLEAKWGTRAQRATLI